MRAIQYQGIGQVAHADVAKPSVTAGQVLLRVTAAGVCQTDIHMRASTERMVADGTILGHEIAGEIVDMADDVQHYSVGEQVVVYPVWSCGMCRQCVAGRENACLNTAGRMAPSATPGVSVNGGMAEFVVVPASALVPASGLDPALAAVLTDAGIVPYHSIDEAKELLRPGSAAVIIGIGGLGQFGVDLLRLLTSARIIALDVKEEALAAVRDRVDHTFSSADPEASAKILQAAGGYGPDFVLDLVGSSATLRLAGAVVAPYGAIRVPGLSDGVFNFETSQIATSLPWGASITRPYSGTYQNLSELAQLARTARFNVNLTRYSFDDALQAFDDLAAGQIIGRAVITMG